jgi:hypothetical protein
MTLNAALAQSNVYFVRVLPKTTTDTDTGTVAWASVSRTAPLYVAVLDSVQWTPGWLRVTVSNGNPLDPVEFRIDDTYASTAALDDSGSLVATSVPVPILAQGSHIVAVATPTTSGDASFTVVNAPEDDPVTPPADNDPLAVDVVKWVLQDPTYNLYRTDGPIGEPQYIFPINPSKMSTPYAAKVFTTEHSTAPDGQPLIFEGSPFGVDWTIEGTCLTEDFHDRLETFLALPRRVYLIDYLHRAWTVTLESINWTRLPQQFNDWSFTYQLKAIIYAGPVQL